MTMSPVEPMDQPALVGDLKTTDGSLLPPSPPHADEKVRSGEEYYLGDSPTEEELRTLRRVASPLPIRVFAIAFIELCERFSYYGIINVRELSFPRDRFVIIAPPPPVLFGSNGDPVTNYIQQDMPPGSTTGAVLDPFDSDAQPGALGRGQSTAFAITTFNQFFQYTMPLFGAFVADQYWGRFRTISAALGVDIVGHLILIVSALPSVLRNPNSSLAVLILAIVVIGVGTGGFKPNISPLIMEQLELGPMRVVTLSKTGERVIVDPATTTNKVYNWFYFFVNVGSLIGQVGMAYAERYVGFWLSFTLPTIVLGIAPTVLVWGRKRYSTTSIEAGGSILIPALRTFLLANKGRWSINPIRTWKKLHDGTFWENVKPSRYSDETRPRWMTFDDIWVDELRRGFNACATFIWLPLYWLCYNQSTYKYIFGMEPSLMLTTPSQQQPTLPGSRHVKARHPQRRDLQPRPVCAAHLYSHLRPAPVPMAPQDAHPLHAHQARHRRFLVRRLCHGLGLPRAALHLPQV